MEQYKKQQAKLARKEQKKAEKQAVANGTTVAAEFRTERVIISGMLSIDMISFIFYMQIYICIIMHACINSGDKNSAVTVIDTALICI